MIAVYYNRCSLSNINAVRVKHAYQLKRVSQSLTTPQRTYCASPNPRSQPHLHSSHQILPILLDSEFLPRSSCWLPFCRVGGECLAPPTPPLRYSCGSLLSISSCMNQGVSLIRTRRNLAQNTVDMIKIAASGIFHSMLILHSVRGLCASKNCSLSSVALGGTVWLSVINKQLFVAGMVVIDAKANIKHSAYEKELGGINCALSKSHSFKMIWFQVVIFANFSVLGGRGR